MPSILLLPGPEDMPNIRDPKPANHHSLTLGLLARPHKRIRAIREGNRTTTYRAVYNGSHFYFTYYHVELQSALPSAGPAIPANTRYDNPTTAAAANSTITLFGIGFDSLLTGEMITHKQVGEAKCRFGLAVTDVVAIGTTFSTTYPVPSATDVGERRTTVQCVAPPMSLLHYMARPIGEVEVTLALNGVHFNSARPPVIYRYYDQRVTYIHPTGGPIGGGTMVTLQGYGLDALSDGGSSLRCRFGSVRVRVELQIVPSRKHDGGGGAGGRFEVRCRGAAAPSVRCWPLYVLSHTQRSPLFAVAVNQLPLLRRPSCTRCQPYWRPRCRRHNRDRTRPRLPRPQSEHSCRYLQVWGARRDGASD